MCGTTGTPWSVPLHAKGNLERSAMPLRSGERPEGKVPVETPGCSADFSRLEASHWREILYYQGAETGKGISIADGTRNRSSSWLFRGQRRLLTNPRAHSLHCHFSSATVKRRCRPQRPRGKWLAPLKSNSNRQSPPPLLPG